MLLSLILDAGSSCWCKPFISLGSHMANSKSPTNKNWPPLLLHLRIKWRGRVFSPAWRCDVPIVCQGLHCLKWHYCRIHLPRDGLKCRMSPVQCVQVNIFVVWMIAVRMEVGSWELELWCVLPWLLERNRWSVVAMWGQCCLLGKCDLWRVGTAICLCTKH
jgi:hypothetical protein